MSIAPNPATSWATVDYFLPVSSKVSLEILTMDGQVVSSLLDQQIAAKGTHQINLDIQHLTSGTYIIHLITDQTVLAESLVVVEDW